MRWLASSLPLLTSTSQKWLCFGCQDISCAHVTDQGLPWLCCKCLSCLPLTYIHAQGRAHTDTRTSACLQAPYSSVSGSFCLPSAYRLEDRGSEGGLRERRVARQNGWSHEQRSVYKPKAEQSKERKGKANCRRSLSTIMDWKRKRGSLPWQSQLEVGETEHDTRRHTFAHTPPLSLIFFSQLKEQMVRGRVGSPPPTQTHTLTDKHTHTYTSKIPNPARGLLLTAWSCPHFVWALREAHLWLVYWEGIPPCKITGLEETTEERRGGWDLWKSSVKKQLWWGETKHRLMPDNYLRWTRTVILNSGCHWTWCGDNTADTKWSQRGPFPLKM